LRGIGSSRVEYVVRSPTGVSSEDRRRKSSVSEKKGRTKKMGADRETQSLSLDVRQGCGTVNASGLDFPPRPSPGSNLLSS